MNSAPPGPINEDDCCNTNLNSSAARLDVYRHERLAYTEVPTKPSVPKKSKRMAAVLKAMHYWVLSRS
jgi:hypothetical protein